MNKFSITLATLTTTALLACLSNSMPPSSSGGRRPCSRCRSAAVSLLQSTGAAPARCPAMEEDSMSDRSENREDNDALQSGEGRPGQGQDSVDFGAGGQKVTNTQGESSPEDRQVERQSTVSSD
jgi:hypothetical protein